MTWTAPVAAACVGLAVGGAIGWRLHEAPPPETRTVARDLTEEERSRLTRTVTVQGPERIVTGPEHVVERWRVVTRAAPTSTPPGCPELLPAVCEEREREVWIDASTMDRGAVSTERTSSSSSTSVRAEQVATVVVSPEPLPRWSLSGGVQLGLDLRPLPVVGAGLRVVGPAWLELSVSPLRPALLVGARVTF